MRFFILALASVTLLSACNRGPGPAEQAAIDQSLAAECAHLRVASDLVTAQTGRVDPAILSGCPGHTQARRRNLFASAKLVRGLGADASTVKARFGPIGAELYKKMLVRGVPGNVATQVTQTQEFANTVVIFARAKGG